MSGYALAQTVGHVLHADAGWRSKLLRPCGSLGKSG
jgi:hypothetical protein